MLKMVAGNYMYIIGHSTQMTWKQIAIHEALETIQRPNHSSFSQLVS